MRLIDADELQKKIGEKIDYKIKWTLEPNVYVFRAHEIFDMIETAPTVVKCGITSEGLPLLDLTPRPRGEWIFVKANEEQTDGFECSVCKRTYHTRVPYFSEFNFCPNCGADMREVTNDS